uniref:Sperm-activating peptide (Ser-3,10 speract) n=1 Tax=Hemicentrotus pulcherrimus TaxID=7650 RepID=Q7M4D0_HEMPU
GFSLNGGGVS